MLYRDGYRRLLHRGGIAIWAAVGLPVLVFQFLSPAGPNTPGVAAWIASLLLFGAAFAMATSRRRESDRAGALWLLTGQTAAVLALVALPPCFGLEGALLVLIALQLGGLLRRAPALAWIAAQSAGLLGIMWLHWGWHWGVVLAFAYVPFQLIADAATRLLAEETAARERLAAANAELEATRELLAQSVRIAERGRIARDLHDLLGHHLTALSLNLEIASHRTEGEAHARVETAQSVTKLLLGDVRAVVGALRQDEGHLDLPAALRKLAEGIPRPAIHIGVTPGLTLEDPAMGEVVLRCAQEIVTNAVRHAGAENLWLDVERRDGDIEIRARDDGRGTAQVHSGHGLSGMRERFEQRGGALTFDSAPGRGFRVLAILPISQSAPS
ncbi:MAG: sensor histidine kinase [Acidobacteriota bacterium]